jgi:NodT family efflux transporter outer membrane factor (OMF) lipoprotein
LLSFGSNLPVEWVWPYDRRITDWLVGSYHARGRRCGSAKIRELERNVNVNWSKTVGALVIGGLVIVGCKVGPNYKTPETKTPQQWGESTTRPTSRPAVDLKRWWDAFDDPQLNAIIDDSVRYNYNLRQATARVREARAARGVVAADWWPTVNVDGGYTRQRRTGISSGAISGNGNNGGVAIGGIGDRHSSLWDAGFDATWEIDVFGSVARNVEAAEADIQSAYEDRNDVLVSLLAEVAVNYVDLRGAQRDLTITQNNLKSQQDTLNLTRERFRAGISSDLDVARAEAQVYTTASQVPSLESQIRQAIHRLGVLTGKDPQALSAELTPPKELVMNLPAVPLGMPSDILRQRPDVRRAERQLAAQTARVGVAVADWFPRFSLTGSYAWQANKAVRLFRDSSNFWSIGPSVSWPIFDAGRIRANIEVENARQEQALDTYSNTVITALQDVEDAIVALDREQARRVALAQSVASNRRAVDLSLQLYQRGLVDFLSVLDAQRALFVAEDLLVRSDTTVFENLISLYKALGGGWDYGIAPDGQPTTQAVQEQAMVR